MYLPTGTTTLSAVEAGELHQEHFNANQYNYLEGSVQVLAFTKEALASRPWMIQEKFRRFVHQFLYIIQMTQYYSSYSERRY